MPPTDLISTLSNQELAQKLREYGVSVGPIVQTTRKIYEKKLRKLESGQQPLPRYEEPAPRYEEVPDDDEEDDFDEEDESEEEKEVQINVRETRNQPRQRAPVKTTPSRATRAHPEPEIMSARTQLQQTRSAPTPVKKEKEKKSGGFPLWTVLFILLFLVAVGYLVINNMEPEAGSNIPNEIDMEV